MKKNTTLKLDKLEFKPERLREARLRAFPQCEYSLRRVATEIFNIAPQRLSMYELGNDNPQPTMLLRMCAAYGITDPMYLAGAGK